MNVAGNGPYTITFNAPIPAGAPLLLTGAGVGGATVAITSNGTIVSNGAALDLGGPTTSEVQTVTVSGGGLNWTLVRRTNVRPGTSEIWQASAPSVLTNVTVTSTLAVVGNNDQSLTVVAF